MQCKYRVILSIDGGGIRGVVPLRILTHLQSEIAKLENGIDVTQWVDVFSGSSTGSIISGALMLRDEEGNASVSPSDMLDLYKRRGKQIFSKNVGLNPENSIYPLSFVLDRFFGGITLEKLSKRFLFVSYDLNSESQYLFTDTADMFRTLPLSKVMIACSAFPGVYPPLELGNLLLADGIVAAKNPAELAFNYARMFYPDDPIIMLSIGTGQTEFNEMDIIDKEMERVHNNLVEKEKADRNLIYFRLQPQLDNPPQSEDDHTDLSINRLLDDTESFIKSNQSVFQRIISLIKIKVEQMA
ncbi:MAG: patatin-like phospholipase/acyl hydrolase [Psychromonas sp.]|jgi:patatin-like phospholipase/acyl hydrolase